MTARTTLDRVLVAGEVAGTGSEQVYRRLGFGAGEPRLLRKPSGSGRSVTPPRRRSLLFLVHLTDLQLADTGSPGRFEFFESLRGMPGAGTFLPGQRPQEVLASHAVEAMIRAVRMLGGSPDTGAPLGLALCTGDNLDNAQLNELTQYLGLLGGGQVHPVPGGRPYEGVQALHWPDGLYWRPDGGSDRFHERWGFPDYPGLLEEAAVVLDAGGVRLPWLSCFGNHDGLPFGEVVATPAYRTVLTGSSKAVGLPAGLDPRGNADELFRHPERFLAGPSRSVHADATRTVVTRRDFVAAHLEAPGEPEGHGFDESNLQAGTAYGCYDGVEGIRILLLDSTNMDGGASGSFGRRQLEWVEERLVEVHRSYTSPQGSTALTGNDDRLVILASHHGLSTLTNDRSWSEGGEEDHPRAGAAEFRAVLHRFPNVVLWLNGHRHVNEVEHRQPPGDGSGFFEVSTAAVADWPTQARLVELTANDDGTLSVLCTMLDHCGDADPRLDEGVGRLAAIHRELAANVPGAGIGTALEGGPGDRNVELVMAAPFPLG